MQPRMTSLLAAALLCSACAGNAPGPGAASTQAGASAPASTAVLAGTRWQLKEIQSMDDSQGTIRPGADRVYSVQFGADGRAAFQLDCNRGTAGWRSTPEGGLAFEGLGMTRAMCPEQSLDTRIARDMGHVRSYSVRAGVLSMSLMADGGIYRWTSAGTP